MRSALALLTIVPVGRAPAFQQSSTLFAFPFVGLLIGASWWLAAALGSSVWSPLLAASLVLAVDLFVTGGLHLDAVADVADGVASRREPDTVREVLADPRIGGIGAAGLVTTLLVRLAAIAALLAEGDAVLLLAVPIVGRAAMVLGLATLPPTEGSLSSGLAARARGPVLWVNAAVAAAAGFGIGWLAGGALRTGLAAFAGLVAAAFVGGWWRRRYGFASGDAAGTSGVLAEVAMLLVLATG